ncbi:Mu-like prophage major head subunit gpT family protein [Neisseria dumasiana]|uniref:Head protein n=1 Tax=Neisseria dumasiana TaxID=1931275 RepID=A0A1X3DLL2_9NEIS|nr:Mu-like prophage major head subunit gpT family protein [Neisseria dumasiana]OSI25067.1 head protein [Neisseria dumasiana]
MIITPESLKALFIGWKKNFQNGLAKAPSQYKQIATVVPSTSAQNGYPWLGDWPDLQKWVGDRQFSELKAHGYFIENEDYANGVKVKANSIKDDQHGIYAPMFEAAGQSAAVWYDQLVFDALAKGNERLCYDGQNFFDTDHPVYQKSDGTGSNNAASNFYEGSSQAWFLLDTSRPLKPLIFQDREKPHLTAMTADTDEGVFMKNEYRYGVSARGAAGYGFWQMAAMSKEELTDTTFKKVYDNMRTPKKDGGRPLNIRPTVLIVPPTLRSTAIELIKSEKINNKANPNHNLVEILESPWIL